MPNFVILFLQLQFDSAYTDTHWRNAVRMRHLFTGLLRLE